MSSVTPGSDAVADTMALVLHLEKRALGQNAKAAFTAAEAGAGKLYVPAMVLSEVLYLSEKKRIAVGLADVAHYLSQFGECLEYPLSFAVIQAAAQITDVPDLHDRLIAGTARHLQLMLLTNDPVLQGSSFVTTTW
jgi:predicted nucleic acid-binding protein